MNEEKKPQTKEKEHRNIYEKMAAVKTKLLGLKKGGKNDYSGYSYFELGDILPVLTPALQEERLYMQTIFSATEQIAKLVLVDIDNTESKLEFEIRFAECSLKGSHEIQNLGAAQTYTRRYLIMTAFDIAEADIVDAGEGNDEKKPGQKQTPPPPKQQPPAPKPETKQPHQNLKRDTWELIKKLPFEEDRTAWLNKCKGADEKTLKGIINSVYEILNPQQPPEQDDPTTANFKKLYTEAFSLIERLPEGARDKWIESTHGALDEAALENLINQIQEKVNLWERAHKPQQPPKTKPATPQEKPASQSDELEIF